MDNGTLTKVLIAAYGAGVLTVVAQTATNNADTARAPEIEIEVTASPITQLEETTLDGANRVVVGRDQLDRLSATDLPTALRQVPATARSAPTAAHRAVRSTSAERARHVPAARSGSIATACRANPVSGRTR